MPITDVRPDTTHTFGLHPVPSPSEIAAKIRQQTHTNPGRRTVVVRHEVGSHSNQWQPFWLKVEIAAATADEALQALAEAYREAHQQLTAFNRPVEQ